MAHQRLQHREINAGLGQRGACGYLYSFRRNRW